MVSAQLNIRDDDGVFSLSVEQFILYSDLDTLGDITKISDDRLMIISGALCSHLLPLKRLVTTRVLVTFNEATALVLTTVARYHQVQYLPNP